jgi:RNA-directed DNA polymerase
MHLTVGGEGFDVRGFHHRWARAPGRTGSKRVESFARWPARHAIQHARDRFWVLTARARLRIAPAGVVQAVNTFLRG